jgi:pimeloyl-ACP methyl ester carboxylesterase
MRESVLDIEGKRYQFLRAGKGKRRLVLLHGLAASKEAMLDYARPLTKEFSCLFLDLPGHNGLGMYGVNDLDSYARYVKGLIEHLGWRRFGIVGFSFGGLVGQRLARIYHDEKKDVPLVVWASPLEKKGISYLPLHFKLFIFLCGLITPGLYRSITTSRFVRWLAGLAGVRLGQEGWNAVSRFDNRSVRIANSDYTGGFGLEEGIKKMIVLGKKDIMVMPGKRFRENNSGMKNTAIRVVDDGGHFGTRKGVRTAVREIEIYLKQYL